jgi:hypothetical protein
LKPSREDSASSKLHSQGAEIAETPLTKAPDRRVVPLVVREFDGIQVDTRDWPVLVLAFPGKPFADAQLTGALAYVESLLHYEGKSFQITDASLIRQFPPATQRKYAAEWAARNDLLFRQASVGGANVAPSALMRGIFTAVHWFQPPPTPTVFVATREQAMAHAVHALEAAGVPLPASLAERSLPVPARGE